MISENTVLILGAGASKPYGYPTALELREEIINRFLPLFKKFARENNKDSDFDNHPYTKKVSQIIESFKKSSTSSIDLFLSRNKSFYVNGKEIITFLLANYEIESKFREDLKDRKYDWYFYLYNILTKDITTPDNISKFIENKISIITFNYDRSFEHFIYESLYNSFISKRDEINNIMNNLKIIHVYGKLAPLPWENGGGLDYRSNKIKDYFEDNSKNLIIIYEERQAVREEITKIITEAKNIYFLGFGYAEENLEAIGLNKMVFRTEQRIYGTAMGLMEMEIAKNVSVLRKNSLGMIVEKFQLENCDSLTLLRNNLVY
ncbi:hypothetical protein [Clostridium sp.]|uniref:hypothetical protein n=1 Tax=Clostridium sp. TaxID=1506 RepID=UPI002850A017|nr:hypothetical protein [Clostridium sp.]MDR3593828.1 hypothetical protein [Clostridium sp.]